MFIHALALLAFQPIFARPSDVSSEKLQKFCDNDLISWNDLSKTEVKNLFEEYRAKLPVFMKKIDDLGAIYLVKCQSTKLNGMYLSLHNGDRILFLADHVFTMNDDHAIMNFLGFQTVSFVLLHELAHAFDEALPEVRQGNPLLCQHHDHLEGLRENLSDMVKAFSQQDYLAGIKSTVNYGKKYGYPTSYALSHPIEMFAEMVSWTYHDKSIDSYSDTELVNYIKSNVLK